MAGRQIIAGLIKSKKVLVISKSFCPYCTMAKDVLSNYGLRNDEYEVLELDQREDADDIQSYMGELTGSRTVPRVFIDGECIGGGSETYNLHNNGALRDLLRSARAIP